MTRDKLSAVLRECARLAATGGDRASAEAFEALASAVADSRAKNAHDLVASLRAAETGARA